MKKIGLVDYFIDEWHSNNYLVWIDKLCREKGYDFEVSYAWAECEEYEGKLSTDQWCKEKNIEKCETIEELCEKSDYIMILAPANPETHLKYAKTVLKYGKNTYIDKTFATNLAEAKEIFELGEKYGTKFFSTSALRYASELDKYSEGINSITSKGGGRDFEEYIIHQIEMLVRLMGVGAEKVKVLASGKQKVCSVRYENGKGGFLTYSPDSSFNVAVEDKDGICSNQEIVSSFFVDLLDSILNFFTSGILPFEKEQTLEVIAIRDALINASKTPDEWVRI